MDGPGHGVNGRNLGEGTSARSGASGASFLPPSSRGRHVLEQRSGGATECDNGRPLPLSCGGAQAEALRLDNPPDKGSAEAPAATKWRLLDSLMDWSSLPRQRVCMAKSFGAYVTLGRHNGRGMLSGAAPCGIRSCPNCGPRIQAKRRDELAEAIEAAKRSGLRVLFLTLTVSHSTRDSLDSLLDVVLACWKGLTHGRWWTDLKRTFGLRHFVRVVECKRGEHGWHPHLHVLLFLDQHSVSATTTLGGSRPIRSPGAAEGRARVARSGGSRTGRLPETVSVPASAEGGRVQRDAALFRLLAGKWGQLVRAAGLHASVLGQDLRPVSDGDVSRLAGYFSKEMSAEGMAWEMTGENSKGGGASLTPYELLVAGADGQESFRRLFREYEQATKGRRLIGYSTGLRKMLELAPPATADEILSEPELHEIEQLVTMRHETFEELARRKGLRGQVLALLDAGVTADELLWWLSDRGLHGWLSGVTPPDDRPDDG